MGKVSVILFPFVGQGDFDLSFALVAKLCCRDLFPAEIQPAFCCKADDIVLVQFIKLKEHLVIIRTVVR